MTEKLHPSQTWTTNAQAARERLSHLQAESLKYRLTAHPIPPTITTAIHETEAAIKTMTEPQTAQKTQFLQSPQFAATLLNAIAGATRQIRAVAYLARMPAPSAPPVVHALWRALLAAPQHCPDAHLILQTTHDLAPAAETNRRAAETLKTAGWTVLQPPKNIQTHAKIWLIDNTVLLVGSHNLTTRALTSAVEASISTTDPIAIHNARAALDHLAHRIARAERNERVTHQPRNRTPCPA